VPQGVLDLKLISVDAKSFHREGLSGSFDACIGASVLVDPDERFDREMDEAWASARRIYDISGSDITLKSAHVKDLIGPSDAHDFNAHVVRQVAGYVREVRFHYTYLNPRRIPQVQVYGRDKGPNVRWGLEEFIEKLNPSYVHCCAWAHLRELSKDDRLETKFLLDGFEGKITRAWEELSSLSSEHLELWFSGEFCNRYILLADIMISYLDSKMNISNARLSPRDISRVFKDEPFPVLPSFLGQRYLPQITPVTRRMCDTRPFIRHPMLFIVGPRTPAVLKDQKVSMRGVIERHPVMAAIARHAKKIGGCIKFFHAGGDEKLFRPGDIMVYVGKDGLEAAQKYSELYGIKILDGLSLLQRKAQ